MATPLHHDQPQQSLRVLQTLKRNPKKRADNPYSQANMPAVQTSPHTENLTNQGDSQHRRSAQQLPPRPPLSSTQLHHRQQQYLRQRHRSELSSPDGPHDAIFLEEPRISTPDRPHAVSSLQGAGQSLRNHLRILNSLEGGAHAVNSLEDRGLPNHDRPHAISPTEGCIRNANVKEQSSMQCLPDFLNVLGTGEGHPQHTEAKEQASLHPQQGEGHLHHAKVKEQSSLHPQQVRHRSGLHSPYARNSIESHLQNVKGAETHQPMQSLGTPYIRNSHPLDYKAAIIHGDLINQNQHIHQPSLDQFHEQPRLEHDLEDYFGCTQDEIQQSSQLDQPCQAEKQRQHVLDSPEMQRHCAREGCDIGCGNDSSFDDHFSHTGQREEKQSHNHLVGHHDHGDQAAVVHEASNHYLRSPQQLPQYPPELSLLASPEDSYFHISKEAVERDYQNECHLATNHEHHANSQLHGHVYDYSRAGVTLVEDSFEERQQSDTSEKLSCDNKICENGLSDGVQRDTQDPPGISEHLHQDVESPPLFLGFNQNSTRFACGTSKGFRVYDIDTMKECFTGMVGGVGLVELLLCTNTLLLVGGGPNPSFPPNKVILWDGLKGAYCGDRSQKFPILAVKLRQDRLVVVVENEVFVYNYSNAKLLFQVNTISNTKGLCAISIKEGPSILACPGLKKGEVRIEHIGTNRGREESPPRNTIVIFAHDSGLACMALTLDGGLLATASDRGTLIRIFSTHDGMPRQEVRRGVDRAEIYSIAFSLSSDWLAVSSDKGTVHVFGLKTTGSKSTETDDASATSVKNPGSTLSFIKGVLPKYFSSQWSFAQFKLPEEMKSVVAFGQEKHSVLILSTNGSFYKCSFDPEHGGDMKQLEYWNFMKTWGATQIYKHGEEHL